MADVSLVNPVNEVELAKSDNAQSGRQNNVNLVSMLIVLGCSIIGCLIIAIVYMFLSPFIPRYIYVNNNMPYQHVEITNTNSSSTSITAVAEKVSPSIVGIEVSGTTQKFFMQDQNSTSDGSGIIISSDGLIITNNHVIENSSEPTNTTNTKIQVILPNQKDKPYTAQIIGRDPKTDLAVIKISATGLKIAEFGNSDNIKIGDVAIAIGNPSGLEYMGSVTVGSISGLNRTIPIEDNILLKLIQTDAAINPGNSGGALLNSQGQVIGVNTAKLSSDGFEGLGFAIPINKVKEITDSLINYKYVKGRPQLGVSIDQNFTEQYATTNGYPVGLLVSDVSPLSGAYQAGLRRGDIILKFDGQQVKTFNDLEGLIITHKPGDKVTLEINRDGKDISMQANLSEDTGTQ